MQISVKTDFSKAYKLLAQLSGPQIKQATAASLNDAAFEARKVIQQEMDRSFDRVTPYVRRSVLVTQATPDNLTATIEPTYRGGKGIDPQKVLSAEIFGGQRRRKRSEVALQRIGLLPPGYAIVPGAACPLDQYGNIKGSFMVQLISYFQAFGEQGYKANSTAKTRAKKANIGRTASGYKTINGVVYIASQGKTGNPRTSHLPAGIWAKSGIHGSTIKPILLFVRMPTYRKRLDFFDKPTKAAIAKFDPRFRYRLRQIIEGTA